MAWLEMGSGMSGPALLFPSKSTNSVDWSLLSPSLPPKTHRCESFTGTLQARLLLDFIPLNLLQDDLPFSRVQQSSLTSLSSEPPHTSGWPWIVDPVALDIPSGKSGRFWQMASSFLESRTSVRVEVDLGYPVATSILVATAKKKGKESIREFHSLHETGH